MTRTAQKLAHLEAISRERGLTDSEKCMVILLGQRERQHARARQRYAACASYRKQRYGVNGTKADAALSKARDQLGRFV